MTQKLLFAVVGLGKIGGNLARQALREGMQVVGYDLHDPPPDLRDAGLVTAESWDDFRSHLPSPRIVFLYIPAGSPVDQVTDQLAGVLEEGDVIIDGGNSYWGDSLRRHARLAEQGIRFVDLGTSGGTEGAEAGACFMAGGEPETIRLIEPILKPLAVEGGFVHAGPPGAGHFVKLVHNGIEFGMLQAIGEGISLLEHYRRRRAPLAIAEVLRCWCHGSVIRSWLVELMERSYREHGGLAAIPPYVEDTGEVNWLVSDAMQMEVPVPVIAQSVMQLMASRDEDEPWARAIAMMRHEFGGHPFGADAALAHKRQQSRLEASPPPR
jgi:6-phosphogluconate dehydrogenase